MPSLPTPWTIKLVDDAKAPSSPLNIVDAVRSLLEPQSSAVQAVLSLPELVNEILSLLQVADPSSTVSDFSKSDLHRTAKVNHLWRGLSLPLLYKSLTIASAESYHKWQGCRKYHAKKGAVEPMTTSARLVLSTSRIWWPDLKKDRSKIIFPSFPRSILRGLPMLQELDLTMRETGHFSLADLSFTPRIKKLSLSGSLTTKSVYPLSTTRKLPETCQPTDREVATEIALGVLTLPAWIALHLAQAAFYKMMKTLRRSKTPLVTLDHLTSLSLVDCAINGGELVHFAVLLSSVRELEVGGLAITGKDGFLDTMVAFLGILSKTLVHVTIGRKLATYSYKEYRTEIQHVHLWDKLLPLCTCLETLSVRIAEVQSWRSLIPSLLHVLPATTTTLLLPYDTTSTDRLYPLDIGGLNVTTLIHNHITSFRGSRKSPLKRVVVCLDGQLNADHCFIRRAEMDKYKQCWDRGVRIEWEGSFRDGKRYLWDTQRILRAFGK